MRVATSHVAFLVLGSYGFLCLPGVAQESPVTVTLSLVGHKTIYKIGEPILLHITFLATEPGLSLNTTTTEPASPVDEVVISPSSGVFPWLDDQARGQRYRPDYAALATLDVSNSQIITLPLNAVYRIDMPGHYTVHVVTDRVSRSGARHFEPIGPLTTNSVSFEIQAMSEEEDAHRAAVLEREIRQAADLRIAQRYAEELNWLTGDVSTRVKLSLFLHPKTFYPFAVDVTRGLWIARNRTMVVTALEQALHERTQTLSAGSSLLRLTVSLKARLESPFNPDFPSAPLQTEHIESEYLKLLAASLPDRQGEALVDAARAVFVEFARRKHTTEAEFAAAREVLITHFGEVNEFNVDWLLNAYGDYLRDERIVPALEQILQKQYNPTLNGERTAVLKQLMKITGAASRTELAAEVCGDNPTLLQAIDDAPFQTLPETDDCLKSKIHAALVNPAKQLDLQGATELTARFATSGIYDDLLALYRDSGSTWDTQAQGYILGYFVRWDPHRGLPLLEDALPPSAPRLDFNLVYALNRAYSPSLEAVWRRRMADAPPEQAGQAAWLLSENGPAEDQARIRERLESWRAEWNGRLIPEPQARFEADLTQAVMHGKNWHIAEHEAAKLRNACLSSACHSVFPSP